ncbi:MAG: tryptophanase [Planctomycetes bacterium]|nr:tryptophanase [Planctomycetota bacterium]
MRDLPGLQNILEEHKVPVCCGGECSLAEALHNAHVAEDVVLRDLDRECARAEAGGPDDGEPHFHTLFEPFRIKSVEPLGKTTRAERRRLLESSGYNLFRIPAAKVLIDLLTDSGTSAMSADQWGAVLRGDESYAGSRSFFRFEEVVRDLTGFKHIIPTHQGRAAEKILFSIVGGAEHTIPSNTHFDTTRANVEFSGAHAVDFPTPECSDTGAFHPFKGNVDLDALEDCLLRHGRTEIPLVLMTLTNNSVGGQPVSLANLRAVRGLCNRFGVPLFLDAARFAENCWFIKAREPGQERRPLAAIARDIFALADGCLFSGKKDGLSNMGGFLGLNDDDLADRARTLLVLTEGFPTYGGMAGRDLEALAVGLSETLDEEYLRHRVRSVAYLGEGLRRAGVPIVEPVGGHAVFVDAGRLLPHLGPDDLPGQALACALYAEGGVRGVEIGTLMFGRTDRATGRQVAAPHELVRLAVPRRVYTRSHLDYVVEVMTRVAARRERILGLAIAEEPPYLRHFRARMQPKLPLPARIPCPEVW